MLVVTIVHHPQDARIRHRQIPSLLQAGHSVTYAAPFTGYALPAPGAPEVRAVPGDGQLTEVDLPRARGRRRAAAWGGAWRLLRSVGRPGGAAVDVILVHDPELAALALAARPRAPVIWDVHEDTAAALGMKAWIPGRARGAVQAAVVRLERAAERHLDLLLAEDAYQERFARAHPVVPNTTHVPAVVPPPGPGRVVYVGHLTRARGAHTMTEVARRLARSRAGPVRMDVVGGADDPTARALREADQAGLLRWHGFLPNPAALALLDGATAGLSLLTDQPNYAHSMPTKVVEYLAHGIPVVTTPTPLAARLVESTGAGLVVPYDDVDAVVEAILRLHSDAALRSRMARAGHEAALARFSWPAQAPAFVAEVERVAAGG